MEVPSGLQTLYRHWEYHTQPPPPFVDQISLNKSLLDKMVRFIDTRMLIWQRKTSNFAPPYSQDPILNTYRFCNIYRELDHQTIYHHRLLNPYHSDFSFWLLNMLYCRMICRPETVARTGLLSFANNEIVYQKLLQHPRPKYGNAYIFPISAIQKTDFPTRELFFCRYLPTVALQCAQVISKFDRLSVIDALALILPIFGIHLHFHWTEVLIDVAYQYPQYINLFAPFPLGPGSRSTFASLHSSPAQLAAIGLVTHNLLHLNGKTIYLSAENWEGIGCEFRKYTHLGKGQGRKRIYYPKLSQI